MIDAPPAPVPGCHTVTCVKRITIKPYHPVLRRLGDCENGQFGGPGLKSGLRAISATGTYRNRYQFDHRTWHEAGGRGDPLRANWLEQAYRTVVIIKTAGLRRWPICGRYV